MAHLILTLLFFSSTCLCTLAMHDYAPQSPIWPTPKPELVVPENATTMATTTMTTTDAATTTTEPELPPISVNYSSDEPDQAKSKNQRIEFNLLISTDELGKRAPQGVLDIAAKPCPNGWLNNYGCFKAFKAMNYTDAMALCDKENATLAVLAIPQQMLTIKALQESMKIGPVWVKSTTGYNGIVTLTSNVVGDHCMAFDKGGVEYVMDEKDATAKILFIFHFKTNSCNKVHNFVCQKK